MGRMVDILYIYHHPRKLGPLAGRYGVPKVGWARSGDNRSASGDGRSHSCRRLPEREAPNQYGVRTPTFPEPPTPKTPYPPATATTSSCTTPPLLSSKPSSPASPPPGSS